MPPSPNTSQPLSQLDELTRINTHDLLKAFGLEQVKWGRQLLAILSWWPARQFAHKIIRYDALVGQAGLRTAGQWALQAFDASLQISGQANVPSTGPVLLLANHPGMTDTVALFASIARPDLRVIAASRPFLSALPHTSDKLIYIDEHANNNLAAIRATTNHLRNGGAILTFPAGQIEPDPAVLPGAIESLQNWSESIALFARLAPATQIVPVLVSGVLSAKAQRTPLRWLRRAPKDQEWLASTLQIIVPTYRPTMVQVAFGPPLIASQLLEGKGTALMNAVTTAMRSLIETLYPKR
ncbi:1-acyl-sn-glycerol-3-phosphate acyltransferase [soil metagenome]